MYEPRVLVHGVEKEPGDTHDGQASHLPAWVGTPKEEARLGCRSQSQRVRLCVVLYSGHTLILYVHRKPVPIQGTSIKLDTPEAIEQWIAERKKRFPTAQNVDDKQRKMREAIERGQIPFDDPSRRKRRRVDDGPGERGGSSRGGRGAQRGRGRGRGRGRIQDGGWEGRKPAGQATENPEASAVAAVPPSNSGPASNRHRDEEASSGEDANSDSDSDGVPEVVSSKAPPRALEMQDDNSMDVDEEAPTRSDAVDVPSKVAGPIAKPITKPRPKQPRRLLYNPFAQRASLLRNVSQLYFCRN